jgi:MFS family permease
VSAAAPRSFRALRHPGFRIYFVCSALAMMADVIEHVISYFVIFQKFQSPSLAGAAVISHWLPFLTLSMYTGGLAERFDIRRIIQAGMLLFIGVSLAWGWVFLSGHAQMWHAVVLLIVHGLAGVLWMPASQLLLHDIVGREDLQSGVRLAATARYLGMLAGPGIGPLLMRTLGPVPAIFVNALIYLPMVVWLIGAPYGPRFRAAGAAVPRVVRGFGDVLATIRVIRGNPVLLSMTLLAAAAACFIGNAYQAQMPGFAADLGHANDTSFAYSALLGADALGALIGAVALESRGLLAARPGTACLLAMLWALALGGFALADSYALVLPLLFVAGFVELSFNSMAQTLVQLNAPAELRGHVIGVYAMAALGMRMFSGITVGVLGSLIGIHYSLALSAGGVLLGAAALMRRFRQLPAIAH